MYSQCKVAKVPSEMCVWIKVHESVTFTFQNSTSFSLTTNYIILHFYLFSPHPCLNDPNNYIACTNIQDESYKPEWKYLYTATKEYKIKNLSTQELVKVHKLMENNDDGMIEKYFKIMTRSSTSSIWNKCTKICKKAFVDMIKVTDTLQDYFK